MPKKKPDIKFSEPKIESGKGYASASFSVSIPKGHPVAKTWSRPVKGVKDVNKLVDSVNAVLKKKFRGQKGSK